MSTNEADLQTLLLGATAGDLEAFCRLEDVAPRDVFRNSPLPSLFLTRAALASVLGTLRAEEVEPTIVERWALFILKGYLKLHGAAPTVDTPVDVEMDQLTIDILYRLSMLDDLAGPVTSVEIDEWAAQLERLA